MLTFYLKCKTKQNKQKNKKKKKGKKKNSENVDTNLLKTINGRIMLLSK